MPPTLKKLTGHIGFGLCVRASVRPFIENRACQGFEIYIWIPHGKIADTRFFFLVRVFSLSGVMPLLEKKKTKNRMKSDACHIL